MLRGRWRSAEGVRVRPLRADDRAAALELCAQDPVASVLAAAHIEHWRPRFAVGGEALGIWHDRRLRALAWAGANLAPVALTEPAQVHALARYLRTRPRRSASVVGPADQVLALWEELSGSWPVPRDLRIDQPSMVIDGVPAVPADERVRLGTAEDLQLLLPASIAMFTEEVGYAPPLPGYEARIAELVGARRSYVRIDATPEGPQVVFKAEVGALALGVAQIQGVWVDPDRRGEGIAAGGMAAVVADVQRRHAPVVSLYVNDFNTPALATYRRAGFRQVGSFATVLL